MTVQYNAESEDKNPTAISFYLGVNILESLDTHTVTAKDDLNGFEIAKHFFGEEKLRTYSVTLSKAMDDRATRSHSAAAAHNGRNPTKNISRPFWNTP